MGESVEEVTLRGAVTLGLCGLMPPAQVQFSWRKQGNTETDLTVLLPLTSCRDSPLDKPTGKQRASEPVKSDLQGLPPGRRRVQRVRSGWWEGENGGYLAQ